MATRRGVPRRSRAKAGQALMELAVGMFTLTLVVSALVAFATYIAKSLAAQNLNRGDPPKFKETYLLNQ